jgi:shikimate kinase
MRLSFIGMSGIGKSYWSSRLVERGFKRFCCDDLIAKKLTPQLARPDDSLMSMGEWMGFPFEPDYAHRQTQYLKYEIEVMHEILNHLETNGNHCYENVVIDTTGSVIYTGRDILERLKAQTRIVYLDAPLAVQEKMRRAYVAHPTPVLWGDKFNKEVGETNEEALARCYPKLLSYRACLYEQWMDVCIDYETLRSEGFDLDEFLPLVLAEQAG